MSKDIEQHSDPDTSLGLTFLDKWERFNEFYRVGDYDSVLARGNQLILSIRDSTTTQGVVNLDGIKVHGATNLGDMSPIQYMIRIEHTMAIAHSHLGDVEQAMLAFDRAIALDPKCTGCYFNKGVELLRHGMYDKALEPFDHLIDLHDNHGIEVQNYPEVHDNRGLALCGLGNQTEALTAFRNAAAVNPNYSNAYAHLGMLSHFSGDSVEALEYLNKAFSLDSTNPIFLLLGAKAMLNAESIPSADVYNLLEKALESIGSFQSHEERMTFADVASSIAWDVLRQERLGLFELKVKPDDVLVKLIEVFAVDPELITELRADYQTMVDQLDLVRDQDRKVNIYYDKLYRDLVAHFKPCDPLQDIKLTVILDKRSDYVAQLIDHSLKRASANLPNISGIDMMYALDTVSWWVCNGNDVKACLATGGKHLEICQKVFGTKLGSLPKLEQIATNIAANCTKAQREKIITLNDDKICTLAASDVSKIAGYYIAHHNSILDQTTSFDAQIVARLDSGQLLSHTTPEHSNVPRDWYYFWTRTVPNALYTIFDFTKSTLCHLGDWALDHPEFLLRVCAGSLANATLAGHLSIDNDEG